MSPLNTQPLQTTLGIDLGTQSVKVLFYDFETRTMVATASAELDLDQDESGKAEQRVSWWTSALCRALREVSADVRRSVIAISVSGQQHGFVALSSDGEVLAPVKLWCDTSTEVECREIMQRLGGEDRCLEISGNKILPGFTASKVLKLKKTHAALYAQLDAILLPHDYLNYWLTGEKSMEMGDASGTGFLDVRARQWSREILSAIDSDRDLADCLPSPDDGSLRDRNAIIGAVSSKASASTGLPEGTPVAIGGGDNMMGAIGTGNLLPGRMTISLGTSGTIYAYTDNALVDRGGNISAFCSSTGGWLPLLCTMNCTISSQIFRSLLDVTLDDFEAQIASAPIGSQGVITLPFFNGERTPNLPNAKGCVLGLDPLNSTPSNLLRSGVEGASFALRFGFDQFRDLGVEASEIILTGGGAYSAVWRQIIADVMGVPVVVARNNDGAAFGAALQAYAASHQQECSMDFLGSHYNFDNALRCQPNLRAVDDYESYYQKYLGAVYEVSKLYA